jgi:hypothetical protein
MSSIFNPSAPGHPSQVVAEEKVRAPLDGFTPWATPTLAIPLGADEQIVSLPNSVVDFLGMPMNRREGRDI